MSSGASRILLLLAASIFLTGCKLAVVVGEGGMVQSTSKTRDCAASSNCAFEVSDASFSETFTAVPLPGYKFEKWQTGPGFVCFKTPGPTCTVSNTMFKDVPAIQAIIASDAVFTLKPLFTSATATAAVEKAQLVVRDASGLLLGEVMDLKNGTDAGVRQVYTDKDKQQHGYMVYVNRMYMTDSYGYSVYWLNATCTGKEVYVPSPMILEPLFSNRYLVARKEKSRTDVLLLLQLAPPKQAKLLTQTYAMESGVCQEATTKLPLVKAAILDEDYSLRYTPPFGVYRE